MATLKAMGIKMKQNNGFTIIELMITVTILGILVALGAPSFQQMIENNRIATETNKLLADLNLARSEALKIGSSIVTVCATTDGNSCSGGSDWSGGWVVFIDKGTAGMVETASGDVVLSRSGALKDTAISSTGFSTSGYVSFRSTGSMTSSSQGSFTICRSGLVGRVVTVSLTGRSTLTHTAGNCS